MTAPEFYQKDISAVFMGLQIVMPEQAASLHNREFGIFRSVISIVRGAEVARIRQALIDAGLLDKNAARDAA